MHPVASYNGPIGVGVDLGSSSVRVGAYSLENDSLLHVVERPVRYYSCGSSGRFTQSTGEIMAALQECLDELGLRPGGRSIASCGVAATCSMAVFAVEAGGGSLEPLDVSGLDGSSDKNVVFWMDSVASEACGALNKRLGTHVKAALCGGFIPEMGVPKLLHLVGQFPSRSLEVFDLHKYIAYDLARRYGWDTVPLANRPNSNGIGHDGEVGGWPQAFYQNVLKLPATAAVGPVSTFKGQRVGIASCIDCYASWFGVCSAQPEQSLFLVAGTSTCYLYASATSKTVVPGVWGPFTNLLDGEQARWSVYEAGQSTTGRLLEHLFETHPAARDYAGDAGRLFKDLENRIAGMEADSGCSIHHLARHMFLYGELQGNRTPYADPRMCGMFVGETTDTSFANLALKYVVVLEFLAFQTRQIVEGFRTGAAAAIGELRVAGSQAKNRRLLSLMSLVNGNMPVRVPARAASLAGVRGAYLLGKSRYLDVSLLDVVRKPGATIPTVEVTESSNYPACGATKENLRRLLEAKYAIHLDMAQVQQRYRSEIDAVVAQ